MKERHKTMIYGMKMNCSFMGIYIIVILLVLFCVAPFASAEDELDIKKDNEKTVYTIGSKDDQKKDEDKENSWEMLKNMKPWIQVK